MTLNGGFDRTVKDWLHEEAEWTTPGYLDQVIAETSRTRQRPAWSSLERWLPVATTLKLRLVPQPRGALALAILVALLLAAALVAFSGVGRPRLPTFGAQANGAFAFVDGGSLNVASADGSVITALLSVPAGATAIAWSPDGTRLAYRTDESAPSIVVVSADGKRSVTVATGVSVADGDRIAWSPDSQRLAFTGLANGLGNITIVNADGTGLHVLGTPSAVAAGERFDPAWSPDGQWISFSSPEADETVGAFLIHPDGSGVQRLDISSPRGDAPGVAWSPDPAQRRLVYGAANGAVMLFDIATSRETRIGPGFWPTWSPDGTRIAWWHDGTNIGVVADFPSGSRETVHPFPLFTGNCDDFLELTARAICSPAGWSPDGEWVYGVDVAGTSLVFGRSDGTGDVRTIALATPMLSLGQKAELAWQPVAP